MGHIFKFVTQQRTMRRHYLQYIIIFLFVAICHTETRLNEKICYEGTEDSSVILPEKIQCRALNKAEPPGWYIPEEN